MVPGGQRRLFWPALLPLGGLHCPGRLQSQRLCWIRRPRSSRRCPAGSLCGHHRDGPLSGQARGDRGGQQGLCLRPGGRLSGDHWLWNRQRRLSRPDRSGQPAPGERGGRTPDHLLVAGLPQRGSHRGQPTGGRPVQDHQSDCLRNLRSHAHVPGLERGGAQQRRWCRPGHRRCCGHHRSGGDIAGIGLVRWQRRHPRQPGHHLFVAGGGHQPHRLCLRPPGCLDGRLQPAHRGARL
mmetsp:Transcript_18436/g.40140  ORF Transcript_18436/g.40140 Transcript_18436/m.40140 type:complete len:237 (-) Transcript_18436:908-1618(-)